MNTTVRSENISEVDEVIIQIKHFIQVLTISMKTKKQLYDRESAVTESFSKIC